EYDGADMLWGARSAGDAVTYEKTQETVAGRTGVYKWDVTKSGGWNDKIMVYESAHSLSSAISNDTLPYANQDASYANLTTRGYNYITVDVYFGSSGATLRVASPDTVTGTADKRDDYVAGSKFSADNNDCIEMYYQDETNDNAWTKVEAGATVSTGVWYRIVFDHVNSTHTSGKWSAIFFSGTGVFYFDNVRYYSSNPFAA
ncbi:MAG: hypothetical protein IJB97_02890, partial [Clostridia bacterium]|nr:hypothetical protein [Clostridia bacterium]